VLLFGRVRGYGRVKHKRKRGKVMINDTDETCIVYYHAFTDGKDEYFETYEKAWKCCVQWRSEGYGDLRIYELYDYADSGVVEDGDCLYSRGNFPC
jgi:hypothetical protein